MLAHHGTWKGRKIISRETFAASHCFRQNCLAMNDLAARLCSA